MARNFDPPISDSIEEAPSEGISFTLHMPKQAGLSWGSDLSFRWVYVLDVEPTGAAFGQVQKGDYIIGIGNTSCIAQDFDFVLNVSIRHSHVIALSFDSTFILYTFTLYRI